MKNKFTKSFLLLCALLLSPSTTEAQRHLYLRLDVGSGNIYTFAASNIVTGFINLVSKQVLFDNSFLLTYNSGSIDNRDIDLKGNNKIGLVARDAFNELYGGLKLGYQSDNIGNFNWGIYGSAHYKLNQYRAKFPNETDFSPERFSYFKPGAGLFMIFGSIQQKTKVQVEAALRYAIPIGYKGMIGTDAEVLNSGLASFYALKFGGYSWFNFGFFAEVNHFDIFKTMGQYGTDPNFGSYTFGLTLTINPKSGEDAQKKQYYYFYW